METRTLHPVSIMDLNIADLADLEADPRIATPLTDWDKAPSQAYLMAAILAKGNGVDITKVQLLTLKELTALVDFTQDDEDGPDPTLG